MKCLGALLSCRYPFVMARALRVGVPRVVATEHCPPPSGDDEPLPSVLATPPAVASADPRTPMTSQLILPAMADLNEPTAPSPSTETGLTADVMPPSAPRPASSMRSRTTPSACGGTMQLPAEALVGAPEGSVATPRSEVSLPSLPAVPRDEDSDSNSIILSSTSRVLSRTSSYASSSGEFDEEMDLV